MRWPTKFLLRLRSLFRRTSVDQELSSELQFHVQQQMDAFMARGMKPAEARAAALRELGGLEQIKEECRETRRVALVQTTLQDLRYAARTLVKNPGFSAVVIVTLALGIGANTAVFSLVNGILLEPLPYPDSQQLVNAAYTGPVPEGALLGFQQRLKQMEVAGYTWSGLNLSGEGNALRLNGTEVSSNFFNLLEVGPLKGRVFRAGDEQPGQNRIAIISYGLWQTRFGGDPNIIGRSVIVDEVPREVVGVMPVDFGFPAPSIQMWLPAQVDSSQMWNNFRFWMVGRMKPGVQIEAARAEFKAASVPVMATFPWQMGDKYASYFNIGPLQHDTVGRIRPMLLLLLGAVGLILMIACVNVANLLLSRSATRQREVAVRAALGASRSRIVRQLLTESSLFALAGGALGVVLAFGSMNALKSFLPSYTPRLADVHIDLHVLGFTLLVTLLTGFVFGMAPAMHASVADLEQPLRAGAQTSSSTRRRRRLSSALVLSEVAIAVVLVNAAGLLIRSLYLMANAETGVKTDHLITAHITPDQAFCHKNNGCRNFYTQVLQELHSLPGVQNTGLSDGIPLFDVGRSVFAVKDRPEFTAATPYAAFEFSISPDYLPTMGIAVLKGRNFDSRDAEDSPKVVLVEKKLADFLWPGQDPVGKHLKPSWMKEWRTVVGVVQNVREYNVAPDDGAEAMVGAVYFPLTQGVVGGGIKDLDLVVRIAGEPRAIAQQLRKAVARVNPSVPVNRMRTMDDVVKLSVSGPRSTMMLFTMFAGLALGLGLIGIYSMISYSVAQRTREIAIRMAMGAGRWEILKMVLGRGSLLSGMGIAVGIGTALLLGRLMTSLLYGIQPSDPITLAMVAVLVAAASAAASCLPSIRATRVDPTAALKYE